MSYIDEDGDEVISYKIHNFNIKDTTYSMWFDPEPIKETFFTPYKKFYCNDTLILWYFCIYNRKKWPWSSPKNYFSLPNNSQPILLIQRGLEIVCEKNPSIRSDEEKLQKAIISLTESYLLKLAGMKNEDIQN